MDSMHGKGTYDWSNGDRYVGDWKENLMNGKGVKTYGSNGSTFDGTWINGYKKLKDKV